MTTSVTVSGQTGGPEDLGAMNAVLFGPLRHVASATQLTCFVTDVQELAIIYRVSGSLAQFPGAPVGNVRIGRANKYISIDIVFEQCEWAQCDVPCASRMLQARLACISQVLLGLERTRRLLCGDVEAELAVFALSVLADTEQLPRWARWVPGVGVRDEGRS